MTQIKLSIAFVLAAAAIAPIVAQPIRDGNEFASNVVDLPHHHRHHHHHHRHHDKHVEQSPLERTSEDIDRAGRAFAKKNGHIAYDDKPKMVFAREDFESDEMFERAESEDVASSVRRSPHLRAPPRRFGRSGPVISGLSRPFRGAPLFGRPFGGGRPTRPFFMPVPRRPGGFGPSLGPIRRGPAIIRGIGPREFAVESDDMFERELEDLEFDARDFDDELNLD